MRRLEDLIRDTLTDHEADAPDGADLLAAVHAGIARHRRRGGPVVAVIAAVCVVAVIAVSVAAISATDRGSHAPVATGRGSHSPASVAAPTTFVSSRFGSGGRTLIVLSDARTGAVVKTLLSVPSVPGTSVSGTAIAPNGEVWVTLNTGPACTSNGNGCGPKPHSCSSTVIAVSIQTGTERTVLRGGDDELITDVQPSPTGDRIAYLHSGCVTSFFDNSLRIRNHGNGRVVSIGDALPRCHLLFQPRWTADGKHLAVVYAEASTPNYQGGQGTCSQPKAATLVVVSAEASQPRVEGPAAPLDAGCEVDAIAVTEDGYAGIEHCGAIYISGPVRLVRYTRDLRPTTHALLGQCEDGASLAGNVHTDTVIASTYQFCNPPDTTPPTTKVFLATSSHLQLLLALPGGATEVDHIAF
jgi:hypothetical protein